MENSQSSKFGSVFSAAFAIFKKSPGKFMAIILIPAVLSNALGLWPILFFGSGAFPHFEITWVLVAFILVIVVIWLLQAIGQNSILRGAYLIDTTGKLPFAESLKTTAQKLGKIIAVAVKIFFYSYVWLGVVPFILYFIVLGYLGSTGSTPMSDVQRILIPIVSIAIPISALFIAFLIIVKSFRLTFSYPILMTKDVTSKQALDESIALTKNKLGRVIGNYILLAIITGLAVSILTQLIFQIISLILPHPANGIALAQQEWLFTSVSSVFPGIIIGSFSLVFTYTFMKHMEVEKKAEKDTPTVPVS